MDNADVKVVTKEIYARFKREKMNPTQPASVRSQVPCICERFLVALSGEELPQGPLQLGRPRSIRRQTVVALFFVLLFAGIGTLVAFVVDKTREGHREAADTEVDTTSFESGFEGWTTSTFLRHKGGTATPHTGPSSAYDGSYYVYAETSEPNAPGVEFSMHRNFGQDVASVSFYYSMYGATMGTALLQGSDDGGSTYTTLWSKSGSSNPASMYASWHGAHGSMFGDGFQLLRFVYTSGSSNTGDFALDYIRTELKST